MSSNLVANFQNNISGFHPSAEKIVMADSETQRFEHAIYILVSNSKSGKDIYNIKINCEIPYTFFRDLTFLGNNLVIAVDNYVYFFYVENKQKKQFKLDGYFERFHFSEQCLLIATHTHLSLFSHEAKRSWVSDKLAVEKIIIKVINDELISGQGIWTDEIGLKEFSISLSDGKHIGNITKKKRQGVFSSLFA